LSVQARCTPKTGLNGAGRIKLDDADERKEVFGYLDQAGKYWQELLSRATAD